MPCFYEASWLDSALRMMVMVLVVSSTSLPFKSNFEVQRCDGIINLPPRVFFPHDLSLSDKQQAMVLDTSTNTYSTNDHDNPTSKAAPTVSAFYVKSSKTPRC